MLGNPLRPVIMVSGGVTGAAVPLRRLCEALNVPVVASTAGKGIVPDDHPLGLIVTTEESGGTTEGLGLAPRDNIGRLVRKR